MIKIPSKTLDGLLVFGYAVTPLHPGAGRTPGVVDQVIQRDPLGYPIIFSSSVKGAFKAECARRAGKGCFNEKGRIKCSEDECSLCCCLFGGEPGEQEPGILSVLDFTPLFIPVPSLSEGYVYLTTPYLIRRALGLIESIGTGDNVGSVLRKLLEKEGELDNDKVLTSIKGKKVVYISTMKFNAISISINDEQNNEQGNAQIDLFNNLGPLTGNLHEKIVVIQDSLGPLYIEKGLVRVTRIRLNLRTKTVAKAALWSEEYIPQGTVFLGGFIVTTPKKNKYCKAGEIIADKESINDLLLQFRTRLQEINCTTYAIIGGKETIGRGLIKLRLYPCQA